MASVFITDREPIEKIFDRGKADALKIRRALWADALQISKGCLQEVRHTMSLHNDGLSAIQSNFADAGGE